MLLHSGEPIDKSLSANLDILSREDFRLTVKGKMIGIFLCENICKQAFICLASIKKCIWKIGGHDAILRNTDGGIFRTNRSLNEIAARAKCKFVGYFLANFNERLTCCIANFLLFFNIDNSGFNRKIVRKSNFMFTGSRLFFSLIAALRGRLPFWVALAQRE